MKTLAPVWLVAIAAGGVLLSGCQDTPPAAAPTPPEVTVATPVKKDVVRSVFYTGRTEAIEFVEIRARVTGELRKKYIPKKDEQNREVWDVKAGETLFEIEPEPYQADVDAAEARKAQTEAAIQLSRANLDRAASLLAKDAVSKQEYETRAAEYNVSVAQLKTNVAEIEQAKIQHGYTTVTAPIGGRVSENYVDVGNLVSGTDQTLLATISKMDEVYVHFDINEKDVLTLLKWRRESPDKKLDATIYLAVGDEKDYPHEGVIDYLENQVDPTTGTAIARGRFSNKNGLLYSGLFARLKIPTETQKDALLVSERAIGTDLGGKYVLVVGPDNVVEQRYVELGAQDGPLRVIEGAIGPDDKVIIDGLQRARPGLPVEPEMGSQPTPPPAEPEMGSQSTPPPAEATATSSDSGGDAAAPPEEAKPEP